MHCAGTSKNTDLAPSRTGLASPTTSRTLNHHPSPGQTSAGRHDVGLTDGVNRRVGRLCEELGEVVEGLTRHLRQARQGHVLRRWSTVDLWVAGSWLGPDVLLWMERKGGGTRSVLGFLDVLLERRGRRAIKT